MVLKNVSALPREALDALVTKAIHEARTITADEVASLLFTTRKRGIGELPSEVRMERRVEERVGLDLD